MSTPRNPAVAILAFCLLYTSCTLEAPPAPCTDPLGCVVLEAQEPIKLGVLQALSGKVAPLGQEQLRGLELALNERQRTILGHTVQLQIEDTGCTSEGGANAALKVVADPKTVAIFGTTCSSDAATASKVMSDAGLSMISGNNSAPFLTSIGGKKAPNWQPGYFRTAPNEEYSGRAAANFAFHRLGIRRAATINDGDIYTRGLAEGFARTFAALGGSIVLEAAIGKGDNEMGPVLTAVAKSQAELLFFPLFQPEGNHLLAQAKKMESLANTVLMSDGALIENSFITAMGELARGMYFVGPRPATTPQSGQLAKAYLQTFSTAPSASYYQDAYDAAQLLLRAIEGSAITHANGKMIIGREKLRRTLYQSHNIDGITGPLHCDQFGDCGYPRFNILRLDAPERGVEGLQANVQDIFMPNSDTPKGATNDKGAGPVQP